MTDVKPEKLSPDEQSNLDNRLFNAAIAGDTEEMRALLVVGADVHAKGDGALRWAAHSGHTETVKVLLAAGADVHAEDDWALRWAIGRGQTETVKVLLAAGATVDYALRCVVEGGYMETVKMLARHIFAPEYWHGKTRAEIEMRASALYDKIKADNALNPINPERLRKAATILADSAIDCWQQVRPPPPPGFNISPLPAQPRPL